MKTLLLAVLLGLLGMVVALAGDPTPPAIKLVPIATSVAKKSVVVAPAMPRLEIRAGEPGTVWSVSTDLQASTPCSGTASPSAGRKVSNFQMPLKGQREVSHLLPRECGAGFLVLRLETTEFSGN